MAKIHHPDEGRPLRELLEEYKDEYCYVAAANCFIYVGKPSEDNYESIFKTLDEYYSSSNENNFNTIETRKKEQEINLQRAQTIYDNTDPNSRSFTKAKKDLRKETTKMKTVLRKFSEFEDIIKNNISLMDRGVIEVYDRHLDPPLGKIIVIKGFESGIAWDLNEFHKNYCKIEKLVNQK